MFLSSSNIPNKTVAFQKIVVFIPAEYNILLQINTPFTDSYRQITIKQQP